MSASAPPTSVTSDARVRAPRATFNALRAGGAGSAFTWLGAFAATVYLALSGGAYDLVVRSEVGIAIWWLLLLAAVAGLLPRARSAKSLWPALVLLLGYFAWTWIATGWTSSQELTRIEVARVVTYIGVFVLAALAVRGGSGRAIVTGIAAGIAVVCLVAVLSKLVPSWFPADPTARFYATPRLRYPFDYSDGVGEFAALGLPLLLWAASSARTLWARMLSAGALPVVLLCLAMTVSRGGILAAVVGVVVFLALAPDRLPRLASAAVVGAGTLVLILALLHRKGLTDQLLGAAPAGQRHSMLLILVVVVVVVGLIQGALALAGLHDRRPRWSVLGRSTARGVGLGIAAIVAAGVIVLFASGVAGRGWAQFKQPNAPAVSQSYFRLLSVAGSHRYQYWQVAARAFDAHPAHGIGPGTFRFYWDQHQTLGEAVLNAHSLWMETLAELGIVGIALLGGFFLVVLIGGSARAARAPSADRLRLAAAVAAVAAFCAAAAFDWVWQIGVVPMVAMALAAVAVGGRRPDATGLVDRERRLPAGSRLGGRLVPRLGLVAAALVALWLIVVPLATTVAVRRSQDAARRGDLAAALRLAASAAAVEPSAASPRLQEALLLEQAGDVAGALRAVAAAEQREPPNWQIWLVASRLQTEAGHPRRALSDYRHAKSLNPRSPLFAG